MGDSSQRDRAVAVILAGAVAKGAFEAGALAVLAEAGVKVERLVAASSGALNAVVYAAAVRARRERAAAAELTAMWRDRATWQHIFDLDWRTIWAREGVSDLARVRWMLHTAVKPARELVPDGELAPVCLRIVLAPLDGADATIGDRTVTSYERMVQFRDADFDDGDRLDDVMTAVLASASFPFVFAPTEVRGVGRCIDGGAVNNTPIGYALGGPDDPPVDAVIVISPTVEHLRAPLGEQRGMDYLGHLVDMLINERLYRDLREAERRNAALRALAAVPADRTTPELLAVVQAALGDVTRAIDIVQIRPLDPLPGTAFSAFHDADQRAAYIDAGAARARAVLTALGWLA